MLQAKLRGRLGQFELDVELEVGQAPLVVLGPNGAGKTTLLRMLLGAEQPSAGYVRVGDATLFDSQAQLCVPIELRRFGYLPQHYALFPHLSVLDNVAFALAGSARERRERARSMLATLSLAELGERRPGSLSGGEQQRVALARALAIQPRALLLDEPLGALDVGARRSTRRFLASYLRELGIPSLVITHDAVDAAELGDGVLVLEGGRVSQRGGWDELLRKPASPFVEEFTALSRAALRP
ncbi:MAG: ABC transporter ATP-binding protein [Hyphomonadaceae bacterium]